MPDPKLSNEARVAILDIAEGIERRDGPGLASAAMSTLGLELRRLAVAGGVEALVYPRLKLRASEFEAASDYANGLAFVFSTRALKGTI